MVTYLTSAVLEQAPYIGLPDEVDQSNPALGVFYAAASYTNPQGQNFHGTPLVYSVTIPQAAPNPTGAAAFVRFLLSENGRAGLDERGFLPSEVLVGGDDAAVPVSLRGLIQGHYAP